jgi:hypothetical protein
VIEIDSREIETDGRQVDIAGLPSETPHGGGWKMMTWRGLGPKPSWKWYHEFASRFTRAREPPPPRSKK